MADMALIRAGLKANLETIPGLQVSGYLLSNPTFPSAEIFSDETMFHGASENGMDMLNMIVRVLVAATTDIGAQTNLDEYRNGSGNRSIRQAIESDSTLGGACDDLIVTLAGRDTVYNVEGRGPSLGAEWQVRITATG